MRKKIYLISGFTLIELLVAMGIVALLGTSSVAIIGNFNRRQAINIAYDDVRNALAQAKSYALSQVVSGCNVNDPVSVNRDELIGYKLTFDTSAKSYSVFEYCSDPSNNPKTITPAVKTYKLPQDVSFGAVPTEVVFKVLTGGTESMVDQIITISTTGQSKTITVTSDGAIK